MQRKHIMNNTNILILGMIYKKPQSPYDLVKQIQLLGMDNIFACGESTIYIYTKKLATNGLIEACPNSSNEKKTIFQITQKGISALLDEMEKIITNYKIEDSGFTICATFLDIFPPQKASELLKCRLDRIEHSIQILNERKACVTADSNYPKFHIKCLARLIMISEGEKNGCTELLSEFLKEENK